MKLLNFIQVAGKFVLGLLLLLQAFGLLQANFGYWLLFLSAIFLLGTSGLELYKIFSEPKAPEI